MTAIDQRIVWASSNFAEQHPYVAATLVMTAAPLMLAGLAWIIGSEQGSAAFLGIAAVIPVMASISWVLAKVGPKLEERYSR